MITNGISWHWLRYVLPFSQQVLLLRSSSVPRSVEGRTLSSKARPYDEDVAIVAASRLQRMYRYYRFSFVSAFNFHVNFVKYL